MIASNFIKIDKLRTDCAPYEELFKLVTTKRNCKFHDPTGKAFNHSEVPLFALASELQYHIKKAGQALPVWWTVLHAVCIFWLYNMQTGKVWNASTAEEVVTLGTQYGVDRASIISTINALYLNADSIDYGNYLANPAAYLGGAKKKDSETIPVSQDTTQDDTQNQSDSSGMFIMIAAGLALWWVLKNLNKNKKKR